MTHQSIDDDCEFNLPTNRDFSPTELFKLELVEGIIVKRPSAHCKTPYVADVILTICNSSILAHTPALGCCGLSNKDSRVFLSVIPENKTKKTQVCSHRVELGCVIDPISLDTVYIGLNPKLAEEIVNKCLSCNYFPDSVLLARDFKREKTILNSRFDFVGFDCNNCPFVLEVKTVPLVTENKGTQISYFPDGYRKKKNAPVSPRAIKHLNDLIEISETSKTRAIMCYVLQRCDTNGFITSNSDPIYRGKLMEAYEKGVEILIVKVSYSATGTCSLVNCNLFKCN